MKLTIETNEKKFFRQLLEILSSIPPLNKLRPKELDLLAIIMYYNNIYKDLDYNGTDTDGKWYINHKKFDGEYAYKLIKENNKFYL